MRNNLEEKIICAAVWFKEIPLLKEMESHHRNPINVDSGAVFSGFRHGHCLYTMVALTGKRSCEVGEHIQGFLTNKNRFVDRKEAFQIALKQNQILDLNDTRGVTLYSEDLY